MVALLMLIGFVVVAIALGALVRGVADERPFYGSLRQGVDYSGGAWAADGGGFGGGWGGDCGGGFGGDCGGGF